MTNTIDDRFAIAENDVLRALTGIVNAHLIDGIADGAGEVHPIQVVIWRNMGAAPMLPGETSLAVIVHVDGKSVAPYGGSTIYVKLSDLSHAATFLVVRAERLAAEELDRREAAVMTLAELDAVTESKAIQEEAEMGAAEYAEQARRNSRDYHKYTPASLLRYATETVLYVPTPVSGDELARVRAGVTL